MRILRYAAAAAALLVAGASFAAESVSPPPEVERAASTRLMKAGAAQDALAQGAGLFRPAWLSGGAAPDWIVDYAAVPTGRLCGTGGCPLQVWSASRSGRYRVVIDRQVLGHAVAEAPPRLQLDLHGVHCGGTGSDPCREVLIWRDGRPVRAAPPSAGPQ